MIESVLLLGIGFWTFGYIAWSIYKFISSLKSTCEINSSTSIHPKVGITNNSVCSQSCSGCFFTTQNK